jgi:iron complex outermembrane receptor protein
MGVIQYRPAKEFTSTLDLFYSKYERATRNRGIQAPLRTPPTMPTTNRAS